MNYLISIIIAIFIMVATIALVDYLECQYEKYYLRTFCAGVYLAISSVALGFTLDELTFAHKEHPVSVHELSEHIGLKSGEKYPLLIHDTIGGTTGNINFRSGVFRSSTSVNLNLDTAITLAFNHEERGWILVIPNSETTYVRATAEDSGVVLNLRNSQQTQHATYETYCPDRKLRWMIVPYFSYQNCNDLELVYKDSALPDLVSEYIEDATIYLPPEEYDEMFNRQ